MFDKLKFSNRYTIDVSVTLFQHSIKNIFQYNDYKRDKQLTKVFKLCLLTSKENWK